MPKTKLGDRYSSKPPPIDWLWACILERCMALHLSRKDLADMAGVSYETMRRYITTSPWNWPRNIRETLCKRLGVNITVTQNGVKIEEIRT